MNFTIIVFMLILFMLSFNYGMVIVEHLGNTKRYEIHDWGLEQERTLRHLVDKIKQVTGLDVTEYQLMHSSSNQVIDTHDHHLDKELIDVEGINGNYWESDDQLTLQLIPTTCLPSRIQIPTFRKETTQLSDNSEIGEIELTPTCSICIDFYFQPASSDIYHNSIFHSDFIQIHYWIRRCVWTTVTTHGGYASQYANVIYQSDFEDINCRIRENRSYHIFVMDTPKTLYFEIDGHNETITKVESEVRNANVLWSGVQKMFAGRSNAWSMTYPSWPGTIIQFRVKVDDNPIDDSIPPLIGVAPARIIADGSDSSISDSSEASHIISGDSADMPVHGKTDHGKTIVIGCVMFVIASIASIVGIVICLCKKKK